MVPRHVYPMHPTQSAGGAAHIHTYIHTHTQHTHIHTHTYAGMRTIFIAIAQSSAVLSFYLLLSRLISISFPLILILAFSF